MAPRNVLWLVLSLSIFVLPSWAAVLAIDYGTDWIKASLMKPGVPFDVLLNKDSKRKIHASVAWNREDRLFGGDAFNLATRFPRDSFSGLKHVMGVKYDRHSTGYFNQFSQAILRKNARNTISVERPNEEAWTVEELVAMELAYVRHLAEEVNGGPVTEVVVTVPGHFTQAQRLSMLDSIDIAGMKSIALMNDGSAVAINYAMTRSFPEKEHHIIFDAGAGSIRATVASFHSPGAKPEDGKKKKKTTTIKTTTKESADIEVLAVGWDQTASGNELTRRIRDTLVKKFEEKHGKSLAGNDRALARLWKEAERVKGVLSANADASTTVESLHDDIDFKTKTLRAEFEKQCEDLKPLYAKPIEDAMALSGLGWENITSVILMGGHSRVPMIQAAIRELSGEGKLSQNVNTDEAAVLGAAFYGASSSPQFKTKKITIKDVAVRDVRVEYEVDGKNAGRKTLGHYVFSATAKTGTKKTLGFKRKRSFNLRFLYETPGVGIGDELSRLDIPKIDVGLKNLTDRGAEEPVVKFDISLDENGLIKIHQVFAWGEVPVEEDDSLTGKIKNFFGGGSSSSETTTSAESSETGTSTSSAPVETPTVGSKAKVDPKTDPKNIVALDYSYKHLNVLPYTAEQKLESKAKLAAIDAAELAQEKRAEAFNVLEAYVYKLRDLLNEEDYPTSSQMTFREFSTAEERAALKPLVESTGEWLSTYEATKADVAQLKEKKKALRTLYYPITSRQKEADAIPKALADLKLAVEKSNNWIRNAYLDLFNEAQKGFEQEADPRSKTEAKEEAEPKTPAPEFEVPYTTEEIQELSALVHEAGEYLRESASEDDETPKNVARSFTAVDLDRKGIAVQKATIRLSNRKKIRKPEPSSSGKTKTTTATWATAEEQPTASTTSGAPAEETTHTVKDEL